LGSAVDQLLEDGIPREEVLVELHDLVENRRGCPEACGS
jgi:hypothetical protein